MNPGETSLPLALILVSAGPVYAGPAWTILSSSYTTLPCSWTSCAVPLNARPSPPRLGFSCLAGLFRRHLGLQLLGRQAHDVLVLVRVELVAVGVGRLDLDTPGQDVGLPARVLRFARVELRHDLAREQLEALADVLVRRPPGLVEQDHLVDTRRL